MSLFIYFMFLFVNLISFLIFFIKYHKIFIYKRYVLIINQESNLYLVSYLYSFNKKKACCN